MYASYWQLRAIPFHNIENRIWYARAPVHEEAFSRLHFLVEERKDFGLLAGVAGTGKSTVLHQLRNVLARKQKQVVSLDLSESRTGGLVRSLNSRLGLAPGAGDTSLSSWRKLEDHLHGLCCSRQQAVFVFDHFDLGTEDAVPALRRLLHLQSTLSGWLTIIVAVGHSPTDSQFLSLIDRANIRIRLNSLDQRQTALYIHQLLQQAGTEQDIFHKEALELIYLYSGGVPREINRVCDFALLKGMEEQSGLITADIVSSVAEELRFDVDEASEEANAFLSLTV